MPLELLIRQKIAEEGPIPVSAYMSLCLMHPQYGYYQRAEPFGETGDFLTAPEISQTFGEMLALSLMQSWADMGAPPAIDLIELGPGRGLLMRDILRTARALPDFLAAVRVNFVEKSLKLRDAQKEALEGFDVPVLWHDAIPKTTPNKAFIVGNEFLDALPIVQYVYAKGAWRERLVNATEDGFAFVAASTPVDTALLPFWLKAHQPREGEIIEVSPAVDMAILDIANLVRETEGVAVLIDYGYAEHGIGDSFQGVKAHSFADVLHAPGEVDLTAHVNFKRVVELAEAEGLKVYGPVGQGAWLSALGIEARQRALFDAAEAQGLDPEIIVRAVSRLVDPDQMGELFKVVAITHMNAPAPPPFVPDH